MDHAFVTLIDLEAFDRVVQSFHALTGISCGLYNPQGDCLLQAGPPPVCRQWYALNPASERLCQAAQMEGHHKVRNLEQRSYVCRNGIGETCVPVMVRGRHLATLRRGQYFVQPPDFERFRAQARELGLDEDGFLKAIAAIPVVEQAQVDQGLEFLAGMAAMLAEQGLMALEGREQTDAFRAANAEAIEARSRWMALTENTRDAVFLMGLDMKYIYANKALLKRRGYAFEQLRAIPLKDQLSPESWEQVQHIVAQCQDPQVTREFGENFQQHIELLSNNSDGSQIWSDLELTLLRDAQGRPDCLLGVARDITERKANERDLLFAKFSFEYAALPSVWVDRDGVVIGANVAAAELFGISQSEAVGRRLPDISPRFQAGTWESTWRALTENGTLNFESEIVNAVGKHIPLEVYYNRMEFEGREYALVFGRDISSRVAIQQALMASEKHFRDLIDAAPYGVQLWSLMEDGRFLLSGSNRSADRILGLDHQALRGKPLEEAFPGLAKGAHGAAMRTVAATGARYETRTGGFVDDKVQRVFEVTGIQTGPGRMALFFRDITSEAKAQEEMEKTARLESLGVMAGGLAHDFNNLLTAIAGNISLALFDADEPSRVRQYLADAETTAVRARGLTQQLLTFARGGAPQRKVARLDKIIRDSVRFVLTGSRHQSQFEIETGLWPCMVDEGQINQVLHNLIINADQATPEAGSILVGAENLRLKPGGGLPLAPGAYVRVWVADRGVGIAPELQKKIFDPFFTTKKRGSGLGLASSFSIIRAHQGHLGVESAPGLGSTFSFYLPALPDQALADEKRPKTEEEGGLKVLVMDDEDMVRQMLAKMLQLMGHEAVAVPGGADCVARYKEAMASGRRFDLVVLDLTIPGEEGGAEVLRRLKVVDQKVRAIASSGYSTDPVLADFQNYGFVGRLPKPYSREELGLAVATAMRV